MRLWNFRRLSFIFILRLWIRNFFISSLKILQVFIIFLRVFLQNEVLNIILSLLLPLIICIWTQPLLLLGRILCCHGCSQKALTVADLSVFIWLQDLFHVKRSCMLDSRVHIISLLKGASRIVIVFESVLCNSGSSPPGHRINFFFDFSELNVKESLTLCVLSFLFSLDSLSFSFFF